VNFPVVTPDLIEAFILVLVRVSSIILMLPVIGDTVTPSMVKWGMSLLIALVIFPLVQNGLGPLGDLGFLPLAVRIAGELLIGISIGFTARFIFAGIQMAGELLGFQMGFSMASVIDPTSDVQVSVVSEFMYMISLLLFLGVDAHHIIISAISESYQVLSPLSVHYSGEFTQVMLRLSQEVFMIAVKISAPVMAVLLFTNVALGVVARTVPQINIFIVSFPLQISVGLLFIGLTAPVFAELVQRLFFSMAGKINMLLRILS
jgi:flagellar biosynthetic protein FliR